MPDDAPVTKGDMQTALDALEVKIKLYFDFSVEQVTHNMRDAFNDHSVDLRNARKNHERRIQRLEKHAGIFS